MRVFIETQTDVFGFQIAMNIPQLMEVFESFYHLNADLERSEQRECSLYGETAST